MKDFANEMLRSLILKAISEMIAVPSSILLWTVGFCFLAVNSIRLPGEVADPDDEHRLTTVLTLTNPADLVQFWLIYRKRSSSENVRLVADTTTPFFGARGSGIRSRQALWSELLRGAHLLTLEPVKHPEHRADWYRRPLSSNQTVDTRSPSPRPEQLRVAPSNRRGVLCHGGRHHLLNAI